MRNAGSNDRHFPSQQKNYFLFGEKKIDICNFVWYDKVK